jgi:hypothetical protein
MAFDILTEGLEKGDKETRDVCGHALALIKRRWPEKFSAEIDKRIPEVEIKEIRPRRGGPRRAPRKTGPKR